MDAGQENTVDEHIELPSPQPLKAVTSAVLTPSRVRWVSFGLLLLSFGVMCFVLKDANLNNPQAVEKLTEAIGRILIGGGILGWIAWSGSGKRKGYGFFTFSLVCVVMTFICAYYFRIGAEKGKQNQKESNRQWAASLNDFAQQATNEEAIKQVKSTGDADMDAVIKASVELRNNFLEALTKMEAEIAELNQLDVLSPLVVTNKSAIESEVGKRNETMAIIQRYQRNVPAMIEAGRQRFASLSTSANVENGALRGFENSMKVQRPALDAMFGLRLIREKAELDLLRFLSHDFNGYNFVNQQIIFGDSAKRAEYGRLCNALETVIKEAEAFQRRQVEATEAAKTQLKKLAE